MNEQNAIAVEILESIIEQITTTMIQDGSPLSKKGMVELVTRLGLANELLDQ